MSTDSTNSSHNGFLVGNSNGSRSSSLLFMRDQNGVSLFNLFRVRYANLVGFLDLFSVRYPYCILLLHGFHVRNPHSVGFLDCFGIRYTNGVTDFFLSCYRYSFGNVVRSSTCFFFVPRNVTGTCFSGPLRDPYFASDVGRTITSGSCAWRGGNGVPTPTLSAGVSCKKCNRDKPN